MQVKKKEVICLFSFDKVHWTTNFEIKNLDDETPYMHWFSLFFGHFGNFIAQFKGSMVEHMKSLTFGTYVVTSVRPKLINHSSYHQSHDFQTFSWSGHTTIQDGLLNKSLDFYLKRKLTLGSLCKGENAQVWPSSLDRRWRPDSGDKDWRRNNQ